MQLVNMLDTIATDKVNKPDLACLSHTSRLDQIEDRELRKVLKALYHDDDHIIRIFATILNAVFTEGKLYFLFSCRLLEKLLKQDEYATRRRLSGTEYKRLYSVLIGRQMLSMYEQSSQANGCPIAGIMALSNPDAVTHFTGQYGQEFINKQLDLVIRTRKHAIEKASFARKEGTT